jgi:hypothetical protein
VPVTVTRIIVSRFWRAGQHPIFLVKMITQQGDTLVWNTTSWSRVAPGGKGLLSGTVVAHYSFRGVPETRVGHCRLRRATNNSPRLSTGGQSSMTSQRFGS